MTAIAVQHREEIIRRVANGEVLRDIAADLGCKKQAIHPYLRDDPEYIAALPQQALAMIEEAKTETWAAREPVDIARAREISRFAFRYAESIDPERWGQKREITLHIPDLDSRLKEARERVIGHGSTEAAQQSASLEQVQAPALNKP